MDATRLLKRLESKRASPEVLRSFGRDLGHELAKKRGLDALPQLVGGLKQTGGEELAPWILGYRTALGDLLAAFNAEAGDAERTAELRRLARERANWSAALRALKDEPRTPSDLAIRLSIDQGQMSRLLGELRVAGLVEVRIPHGGDARMRPHELTLAGERVVESLVADAPSEDQRAAIRLAAAVIGRIVCEGVLTPSALASTAAATFEGRPKLNPRSALDLVLKEAARVGVVRETKEGLEKPELAVPTAVSAILQGEHRDAFVRSLTKGLGEGVTCLVRTAAETQQQWKHLFVRNEQHRVDGRVLEFGDLSLEPTPPSGNVVLLYESPQLFVRDAAERPAQVQKLVQAIPHKRCIAATDDDVPPGFERVDVSIGGQMAP